MEGKKNIIKELIPYIVIILVVVSIRSFIVTPIKVNGDSMVPTLKDGEILLLKKYDHTFERFDIIVFPPNFSIISLASSLEYFSNEPVNTNVFPANLSS